MTHHTDSGQRLVPLAFEADGDLLRATMESDASVAPPGYYMLFIVDSEGRPCEKASFRAHPFAFFEPGPHDDDTEILDPDREQASGISRRTESIG